MAGHERERPVVLLTLLALGVGLRAAAMALSTSWADQLPAPFGGLLARQPELVTRFSSVEAVHEGALLRRVKGAAHLHDGDVFWGAPLLPVMLEAIGDDERAVQATMLAVDVAIAVALGLLASAPAPASTSRFDAGFTAMLVFLLNPYSVLSCAALNLNALAHCCALWALLAAAHGRAAPAGLLLGGAVFFDAFLAVLAVPVALELALGTHHNHNHNHNHNHELRDDRKRGSVAAATLAVLLAAAAFACLLLAPLPQPWTLAGAAGAFQQSYLGRLQLPDLSPNIGLWWYFFIEMFPESRAFFLFVLSVSPLVYAGPLCLTFAPRPQLLASLLLMVYQVYRPYPDLGGVGFLAALAFIHPDVQALLNAKSSGAPFALGVLATSCLLPVMRYMWLSVGSGNANYYYFQTLILQFCLCNLVAAFLKASLLALKHEADAKSNSNSNSKRTSERESKKLL